VQPPVILVDSFHHRDHLGNLRVTTDAGGWLQSRHDYYPFGLDLVPNGSSVFNTSRVRFTGHERDAATSLDYMKARFFSASVSRFVSPDPLMSSFRAMVPQSANRYAYVTNSPINKIDPFGLQERSAPSDSDVDEGPTVSIIEQIKQFFRPAKEQSKDVGQAARQDAVKGLQGASAAAAELPGQIAEGASHAARVSAPARETGAQLAEDVSDVATAGQMIGVAAMAADLGPDALISGAGVVALGVVSTAADITAAVISPTPARGFNAGLSLLTGGMGGTANRATRKLVPGRSGQVMGDAAEVGTKGAARPLQEESD